MSISLSVYAEVLYENPIDDQLAIDLHNTTLQHLLDEAEKRPVNEKNYKAQYLLGLIFMNGQSTWGVDPDFEKAIKYLQDAWDNNIADAGLALASLYYYGEGVEHDNDMALSYLRESAGKGYLLSQRALGEIFLGEKWKGIVDQDPKEAIAWYRKAGSAGDLESARRLAEIYHNGDIVKQDFSEAFCWTKKSTESKYGEKMGNFRWLAAYYEEGVGIDKDLVQAYKYYDLQGTAGFDDKARLAEEMTQEQIDEAIRLSREWQEKHNTFVPSYDGLEHQPDGSYR